MKHKRGFAIIEIIIMAGIIGLLSATLALPAYMEHMESARARTCAANRRSIEHAEQMFLLDREEHSENIQQLVDEGYLDRAPVCPSGGAYAWEPAGDIGYHSTCGCSEHGIGIQGDDLTPLGSTFGQISTGFSDLITAYNDTYGKYPPGNWKKSLTALGLVVNDWKKDIEGIKYRPSGKNLKIQPGKGYTFTVNDASGAQVPAKQSKTLVYSTTKETWYYGKAQKGREINIDSLLVSK